jgi:hypothetical protein
MRTVLVLACGVSGQINGNPASVAMMPIMSEVDDGWRLRRDSMVQVAISSARVDGYLIGRKGRMRVRVEDQWLLVERAWGSRSSMPGMILWSASCLQCRVAESLALISSLGRGSLWGCGIGEGGRLGRRGLGHGSEG